MLRSSVVVFFFVVGFARRLVAEAAIEEGVAISLEIIESIRPLVQGFHLTATHRRVEIPLRVLRESGVRATA